MIDAESRRLVRERAGERCEYCLLPEHVTDILFHVEHVVAKQHQDDDSVSNLALACDRCNLYKGPNLSSIDPVMNDVVRLFHPRKDDWNDHFTFRGPEIEGLTATGDGPVVEHERASPNSVATRTAAPRRRAWVLKRPHFLAK